MLYADKENHVSFGKSMHNDTKFQDSTITEEDEEQTASWREISEKLSPKPYAMSMLSSVSVKLQMPIAGLFLLLIK